MMLRILILGALASLACADAAANNNNNEPVCGRSLVQVQLTMPRASTETLREAAEEQQTDNFLEQQTRSSTYDTFVLRVAGLLVLIFGAFFLFLRSAAEAYAPKMAAMGKLDHTSLPGLGLGPTPEYPADRRMIDIFEEQIGARPEATALIIPAMADATTKTVTYKALNAAAEELADRLLATGVSCGSVAALLLDRSVAQVVAVFGVLKVGAAFLPIDNAAPRLLKQSVLAESGASVVISAIGDECSVRLSAEMGLHLLTLPVDGSLGQLQVFFSGCKIPAAAAEKSRPKGSDMAMLVYTSGTTGKPKGIVYDQRHLLHGAYFFAQQCEIDACSVALLKSPYFWAVIEWELFPALMFGGKLVVASPTGHQDPTYLTQLVADHQVSVLMITPTVLDVVGDVHQSQAASAPLHSLQHIVTVGEPLSVVLANRTVSMPGISAQLHNFYGASESSCTIYTVPRQGIDLSVFPKNAPAGLPQPHASVYVMQEAPATDAGSCSLVLSNPGDAGEICFGGVLAAGYWNRHALTAEKFVDTLDHGRLYRTGDLGRWTHGVLEVVGRIDRQVKIRGVRVEPEEVEAVLKAFQHQGRAAVTQVAVVASSEPAELVAFACVHDADLRVLPDSLREHCQSSLSLRYVPKFFVIQADLPKLPNGKLDMQSLKQMATLHVQQEEENEDSTTTVDSLGRMKSVKRGELHEMQVMSALRAFATVALIIYHWYFGALGCFTTINCEPPSLHSHWFWVPLELVMNRLDWATIIFLGTSAYVDSKEAPKTVWKPNLFVLTAFLMMYWPLPDLFAGFQHRVLQNDAFVAWDGSHRWYLSYYIICNVLHSCVFLPARTWSANAQPVTKMLLPVFFLTVMGVVWGGPDEHLQVCLPESDGVVNMLLRAFTDNCDAVRRAHLHYFSLYTLTWWYGPAVVAYLKSDRVSKVLKTGGPVVPAALLFVVGATFQSYENIVNNKHLFEWSGFRGVLLLTSCVAACLIALTTALASTRSWFPLQLFAWLGNSSFAAYIFHLYFCSLTADASLSMTFFSFHNQILIPGPPVVVSSLGGLAFPIRELTQYLVIFSYVMAWMATWGFLFHKLMVCIFFRVTQHLGS
mmetsp:Transcript_59575/g.96397  ORF Transcript_59575/g.96397 Transcript_59575/m.96397 type:complete len:1095 (+) Transcript_59575:118-3402(+)